jgi:hypothetical protein
MATNFHKVMNTKYKFPDENSSMEHWETFIDAEITPVKQDDLDKLRRIISLYDEKIQKNKKKRGKDYKLTDGDRQLATMRCEAVYHLANAEARMERQKKMSKIMDKIDWGNMADELNALIYKSIVHR